MTARRPWQHHDGRHSRHARGYGAGWSKLRAIVLGIVRGRPTALCRACEQEGRVTVATDCDHIVPKAKGGTDDLTNLQPLCRWHHDAKSLRDRGARARREVGVDGYPL